MNNTIRTPRPRGRRPGASETKGAIREAARRRFLDAGYEGASLRSIAAEAGVDVALISYYFGSKRELFAAAMSLPVSPPDVLDDLFAGGVPAASELVARMLAVWDDPDSGPPLAAMLQAGARDEPSRELVSGFIEAEIAATLARSLSGPEPTRRARAIVAILLGFLNARYVLRLGFASGPRGRRLADDVAASLQPWLEP
jgi:AcrR family transcriptional regulator